MGFNMISTSGDMDIRYGRTADRVNPV
jgi:hypothetical protein